MQRDDCVDPIGEAAVATATTTSRPRNTPSTFRDGYVRKKPISPFRTDRIDTHAGMFARTTAPSLRQTYRLIVACHISDWKEVVNSLKTLFDEHGLALGSLRRDQTSMAFVRVTAVLAGAMKERAALVRIVNRLATVSAIRRLQWETVPNF